MTMTLKSDAQGFLVGTPVELGQVLPLWAAIQDDVRAIRESLAGSAPYSAATPKPPEANQSAGVVRRAQSSQAVIAEPVSRGYLSGNASTAPASNVRAAAMVDSWASRKSVAVVTPSARDTKGRFTAKEKTSEGLKDGGDGAGETKGVINGFFGRLSQAVVNSGSGMEEADPTVKAFQEVAQPMARGFELIRGGSDDKKQTGFLRRIFNTLNVFRSDETTFGKATNKSLKAIESAKGGEGGEGGGMSSALLGLIPGVGMFSAALAKGSGLLSSFGSMLLKIPGVGGAVSVGKGLLSKIPGLGGLAGGAGAGAGGAAVTGGLSGGAKALGKGFLKRIPILGGLIGGTLAWGEASAAENDQSLSKDEKNGKKGKAWGGAAGGVIGAAVGSLLGPVGTIVGAVVGDWLGGQFGEMIGGEWATMTETMTGLCAGASAGFMSVSEAIGIDWKGIGESVGSAWAATTATFDTIGAGIGKAWDDFINLAKSGWESLTGLFSSAYEGLKSIPVIGSAIQAVEDSAKAAAAAVKKTADDAAAAAKAAYVEKTAPGTTPEAPAPVGAINKTAAAVGSAAGSAVVAYDNTKSKVFNRSVATGADYKQGNIAGLDDTHTRALVASTTMTESSGGKLDAVNSAGYMGRYQAGAGWLADAGQINGGGAAVKAAMKADGYDSEYRWGQSGGMTKFLKNDKNWSGGMTYDKYLSSADAQDGAFKVASDASYRSLKQKGVITDNMGQDDIAGILKARHIGGEGGAAQAAKGIAGPADANGTTALKYKNDLAAGNDFAKAFASPAMPTITASARTPALPTVTASAHAPSLPTAPSMPPLPDSPPIVDPMASTGGKTVAVTTTTPDVGQDLKDRRIAHVVTGSMSG